MNIKGIICDLDGTVVDTESIHTEAWNELVQHFGNTPPNPTWLSDCIGLPDKLARDKAVTLFPNLKKHSAELVEMKEHIFRTLIEKKGPALAFPKVKPLLKALQKAQIKLAVGTNSNALNCEKSLRIAELTEHFRATVTIDQVKQGKPHPDIYLEAAKRMEIDPESCAVLDDSPAGLAAANAAGCMVVAVENTWPAKKLAPYDFVFSKTCEALEWILQTL